MRYSSLKSLWLVMPAALMVALFFLYPLCFSLLSALMSDDGSFTTAHLHKALELYSNDVIFTIVIVLSSMVVLCLLSITIAAILRLSPFKPVVRVLGVLYKFPLFIPLIVTAQIMRTFLAKNGLMNNTLIELGMFSPLESVSFLGWKGIIITFVWKQLAFSTLLLSGAMAAIDESQVRASRNLGGSRIRTLFEIILPQVLPTIGVAMVLSVVTMMSALSVPLMIGTGTPTMITADMAFRINSYGDYHVANTLGLISYCICAAFAWFYLRQSIKDKGAA